MKKNVLNLKTTLAVIGIFISSIASAFTAVTSGNWSSPATWGGVAPGSTVLNADIIIPAGITVTLDADVTFTGLINVFNVTGTLSSTTMNNLTITQGAMVGSGMVSIHKINFTNTATAGFTGSMTVGEFMNSSVLGIVATANVTDSLIMEGGSLSLNANSSLTMMSNSTIRVGNGSLGVSGGGVLSLSNNYNLMYTGTSKTTGVELNGSTVQNIIVKMNSNTENVTLAGNTTVNNNLNMTTGMLNLNGKTLTLKGDLNIASGAMLTGNSNSDLMIEGSGALSSALVFSSGSSLNSLTINRGTTVKLASALNIAGSLNLLNGTYSLESGAALTMNAGSKIHVEAGGMTINSGSFTGTASYDVEYMGAANSNAGMELSGSGLNNVTVSYTSNSSKVTLNSGLIVAGNLNLVKGQLDLNGQNITLNGTLSQSTSGSFIGNPSSEMNLNLSSAATTTLWFDNASAANQTLSKLKLNVSGSTALMLGSTLNIKDELTFIKGKLMIDNTDLVIQSSGNITGYDDTHYIVTTGNGSGVLKMNVASNSGLITFPVGTNTNYSPAYIQQTSAATSGNIMVKVYNDVLSSGYTGLTNSTMPLVKRTWYVSAETGVTVNMNLKLGWVAAAEMNSFNRANAMISHYTNGSWDVTAAASATAGTYGTYELMRTGITSLSPFAVTDASAPLKVKELSSPVAFEMYPNPAKDIITIKMDADNYKYEVTDITGKTVVANAKADNTTKLDVSSYAPGCYFIKMTNPASNESTIKRFIKN